MKDIFMTNALDQAMFRVKTFKKTMCFIMKEQLEAKLLYADSMTVKKIIELV